MKIQVSQKLLDSWRQAGYPDGDTAKMAAMLVDVDTMTGAEVARQMAAMGYAVDRSTVNRWRRTELFTEHAVAKSRRAAQGRSRRSTDVANKPLPEFQASAKVGSAKVKHHGNGKASVDIKGTELAAEMLEQRGFDPQEWQINKLRMSNWDVPNHDQQMSTKVDLERRVSVEEIAQIEAIDVSALEPAGRAGRGGVLMISDLQLGKWEDDPHLVIERTLRCVAEALRWLAPQIDSDEGITLSWLGDNVEGFQSQGGANIFRTTLPIAVQHQMAVAIQRSVTESALELVDGPVTNVCVPSNHGEIHRVQGKGTTTYTDSWDIVAAQTLADLFADEERVDVVIPEEDSLICYTQQSRTNLMHLHGHQVQRNKAHEWWSAQAMSSPSAMAADVGLAAHNHHFFTSMRNGRLWIQTGACEARSTWFKNRTGIVGDPGIVALVVADGEVESMRFVQPDWSV